MNFFSWKLMLIFNYIGTSAYFESLKHLTIYLDSSTIVSHLF